MFCWLVGIVVFVCLFFLMAVSFGYSLVLALGLVVRVFLLVMLLSGLVVTLVVWVLGGSCMWWCGLCVWGGVWFV